MIDFTIEIVSAPDREKLVAEIWFGDIMIAEVNEESGTLNVELYAEYQSRYPFDAFCQALTDARDRLKGKE